MSLIRKPYELDVQTKIKCLIYGQAGVGKTTVALSAPSPLLLDFDGGVHRVNYGHQTPTVQIQKWEDCEEVMKENLSEYKSIIIDTGGKLLDFMGDYIIRKNPKMGKSNGSLSLQGFGERKGMFRQFCRQIMLMDKHLIFVAHRDTQKNGEEIRYVPLFGGSSYDDLVSELDLVGYMEAVGRKRTITFDPTDRNDGKNTCNLQPTIDLPIVVNSDGAALSNTFLVDGVIDPYIKNLSERLEIAKNYEAIVKTITGDIEKINDAKGANDFVSKIDTYTHVGSSKAVAASILSKRCASLKITFDKTEKRYV